MKANHQILTIILVAMALVAVLAAASRSLVRQFVNSLVSHRRRQTGDPEAATSTSTATAATTTITTTTGTGTAPHAN